MPQYTVRLRGPGGNPVKLSLDLLSNLLGDINRGVRGAVRYRLDGRSVLPGSAPRWLQSASTVELDDVNPDDSTLYLSAPSLQDALPAAAPQLSLITQVDAEKSGLTFLAEGMNAALRGESGADAYDASLIGEFVKFGNVFSRGVVNLELKNELPGSPFVEIGAEALEAFAELRPPSYEPQQTRLAGTLDQIRSSDKAFILETANGARVRGVVAEDATQTMKDFWGQSAVVSGEAVFRPSGALFRIEATRIDPANEADLALWTTIPKAIQTPFRQQSLTISENDFAIDEVFGKWPELTPEEHANGLKFLRSIA